MTIDWSQAYSDIEDVLVPGLGLDVWERALYYHLVRHTRLIGESSAMFAVAPLAKATGISEIKTRDVLRSLDRKGCLRIDQRSRKGHLVSVMLPEEVSGLPQAHEPASKLDVGSLDFFSGRRYLAALLKREKGACVYCLKKLTADSCELDHLVPQAVVADNSYRNIVAACHRCNKAKGEMQPSEFLRQLYREELLDEAEFQARLARIQAIQAGDLVPEIGGAG